MKEPKLMIYKELPIHPDLQPYIQVLWMMESENEKDFSPKEQIMPDGIVEIIFHYEEPWMTTISGGKRKMQPKSFAISQMHKYIEIESHGSTGFISVRFFPWGAYHFFGEPVNNFLDNTISSQVLWGKYYDVFMEKFLSAANFDTKLDLVQAFLLARLNEYKKDDEQLDKAVKLIRSSKGQLSIEEISKQTGISKKQLERKFIPTIGTTPKTFARISRFLNLCSHLEAHKNKALSELSYECGYYDQAHFIREFKEFSGYTPKEFFSKNNVAFTDL